ncbi:MAG: Bro-N domain-containing protein [Candidatus Fonsibacter sp.]
MTSGNWSILGLTPSPILDYNDRNAIYINEPGLYSIILRNDMSKAKEFKKWVFSEVLPSTKKHNV